MKSAIVTALVASLASGVLTACSTTSPREKEAPIALASNPRAMKFPVVGMGCRGCAKEITALLRNQPGVADAAVSFEHAEAYVVATEANGATREQIAKVIDDEMKRRTPECAAEGKAPAK